MNIICITLLALTCFVCVDSADWSYSDTKKWGDDYASCNGKIQSPIDILPGAAKYTSSLDSIKLVNYDKDMQFQMLNNGHTLQLNIPRTTDLTASGGGLPNTFRALQFHFHWSENKTALGSEHTIDGKSSPLEVHIVHINKAYANITEALKKADGLAVLGFFFKVGKANKGLGILLKNAPRKDGEKFTSESFSIEDLIESDKDMDEFYRYRGSLTTPPCSEAVVWTLYNKFLPISESQLKDFWTIKAGHGSRQSNFRPPQKLYGRSIEASFKSSGMMATAISVLVLLSLFIATNLW